MKSTQVSTLLFASFLFFITTAIQAQRHKLAFTLTGGLAQEGFGGTAAIDYKTNEFDFVQANFITTFSELKYEDIKVPVDIFSFNPGYFFDIIRDNSRYVAIAFGAGGVIGYEIINDNETLLDNSQTLDIKTRKVIFGAFAGLDVDVFIIPTIAATLKVNQNVHFNSDIGKFIPYIGMGIKLILI